MRPNKTLGSLTDVVSALANAQRILVTSHPNPDGDALGSMLAIYWAFSQLGREVVMFHPDTVPKQLNYLSGIDRIVKILPSGNYDHTILLDCSRPRVFGKLVPDRTRLGEVVVIDHHQIVDGFGDVLWINPEAAAVGVLLFQLFEAMRIPISREIADALYCSIATDTGSFRHSGTSPEVFRIAARLLDAGVDPWAASLALFEEKSLTEIRLSSALLGSVELSTTGVCACMTMTHEMLAASGAQPDICDACVNTARGIEGVEVSVLLRPASGSAAEGSRDPKQALRISMRSRGRIDVSAIAEQFGGGGHLSAAGAIVEIPAATVRDKIFAEVERLCANAAARRGP